MPVSWEEYIQEKQKLADVQLAAKDAKTPASRLAFYLQASFPGWRLEYPLVRKMDDAFAENDFDTIREMCYSTNYLVAAIAGQMRDEIASRLAVVNGKIKPEEYKENWWVKNPQ